MITYPRRLYPNFCRLLAGQHNGEKWAKGVIRCSAESAGFVSEGCGLTHTSATLGDTKRKLTRPTATR